MKELLFIVNGEDVSVRVSRTDTVDHAKAVALAETKNTALAASKWEVRDEGGKVVDGEFQAHLFDDGTRLFLTLPIAAGG